MRLVRILLASAALSAASLPVAAHHSFASFNLDKTVKLQGTVKEFQFTNPHSWLQLVVMSSKGKPEEWSIEMTNVALLVRTGWRPKTLQPGDKITAEIHPLRDGGTGGSLMTVIRADGKKLEVLGQGGIGRLR